MTERDENAPDAEPGPPDPDADLAPDPGADLAPEPDADLAPEP